MLSLNGVSAWIEVEGKELEQYSVEGDPDQSRVTCWIATQENKGFSVVFKDNAAYREHSLGSSLVLDGTPVRGKVLHSRMTFGYLPNLATTRAVRISDQAISATSARPFRFSKLELTDDDDYLNQASAHLGEIQLRIYRVQVLESNLFASDLGITSHGKVHERSKKAVSHCVSYGEETKTETQYICRTRYLDGNTPLATFVFKYRDYGLLQANGITPKGPSAQKRALPSEEVLDLTTSNHIKSEPVGEEVEIVDTDAQTKRSNPSRERETRPAKRIKQEKRSIPSHEVIDLT